MVTSTGVIKKTALSEFSRPRASGIIAVDLIGEDKLVQAAITKGSDDILLFTNAGKVIRFSEEQLRPMGRAARGVRGIKLAAHQQVISLVIAKEGGGILTATHNGYGKRTPVSDYPTHGRGGQGVISIQVTERNGAVVDAVQVFDQDEVMLISDQGTLVRTRVDEISVIGRNTQGVRLIQLGAQEHLVGLSRIEGIEDGECVDEGETVSE